MFLSLPLHATAAPPIDLSTAVDTALAQNPDVELARTRLRRARALTRKARSGFWPRAQVAASYTVTDNPALAFSYVLNQRRFAPDIDFNDVGWADDLGARASLELPLFTGFRRFAEVEAADRGLEASSAQAEAVERDVGFAAAQAWLDVHRSKAVVEAAEAGVESLKLSLAIAERRRDAGTLLPQSVLELETQLAGAEERLVRARNGVALAIEALRAVLGADPSEPLEVAGEPEGALAEPEETHERSELRAARAGVDAAAARIEAARSGWWPEVGLDATIGYDRGLIDDGDSTWLSAGIGIRWRVWDGFATAAQVEEAEAGAAQARADLRRLQLALHLEAEATRIQLRDARERSRVSARAVELAAESTELARARFEQGAALHTQLVDAETALVAARIRNANARLEVALAILRLRRVAGSEPIPVSGGPR